MYLGPIRLGRIVISRDVSSLRRFIAGGRRSAEPFTDVSWKDTPLNLSLAARPTCEYEGSGIPHGVSVNGSAGASPPDQVTFEGIPLGAVKHSTRWLRGWAAGHRRAT